MFNLSTLFKSDPPTVAAIAVRKGAEAGVKGRLAGAGFAVKKSEDAPNATFMILGDAVPANAILVKMDDDVAVVVSNVAVMHGIAKSETGFYAGPSMAVGALGEKVSALVQKGDVVEIAKAFDEAKAYVTGLVKSLPGAAFKLDHFKYDTSSPQVTGSAAGQSAAPAGGKAASTKKYDDGKLNPTGGDIGDGADGGGAPTDGARKTPKDAGHVSGEGDSEMDGSPSNDKSLSVDRDPLKTSKPNAVGKDEVDDTDVSASDKKKDDGGARGDADKTREMLGKSGKKLDGGKPKGTAREYPGTDPDDDGNSPANAPATKGEDVLAAVAQLAKSMEQGFASVNSAVSKLDGRVAKAEEALNGTMVGGAQGDDRLSTRKSEKDAGVGLIDTAYERPE